MTLALNLITLSPEMPLTPESAAGDAVAPVVTKKEILELETTKTPTEHPDTANNPSNKQFNEILQTNIANNGVEEREKPDIVEEKVFDLEAKDSRKNEENLTLPLASIAIPQNLDMPRNQERGLHLGVQKSNDLGIQSRNELRVQGRNEIGVQKSNERPLAKGDLTSLAPSAKDIQSETLTRVFTGRNSKPSENQQTTPRTVAEITTASISNKELIDGKVLSETLQTQTVSKPSNPSGKPQVQDLFVAERSQEQQLSKKLSSSGLTESGKLLPLSGNPLPPDLSNLLGERPVSLISKVEDLKGATTPQFLIKGSVAEPGLEIANLLSNSRIDQSKLPNVSDALKTDADKQVNGQGLENSLLNIKIDKMMRSSGLAPRETVAETGQEKVLINAGILTSQLLNKAIVQNSPTTTSKEPAGNLQISQADSQASSFLANYQTNINKPVNTQSSIMSGVEFGQILSSNLQTGSQQWSNELSSKIRWMSSLKISSAELKLHPAELGKLEILIASEENQTRVNFVTSNAAAKDIIEASLPRLRELLSNSGLLLEQSDVTHQDFTKNDSGRRLPVNESTMVSNTDESDIPEHTLTLQRKPNSDLQVDHYV